MINRNVRNALITSLVVSLHFAAPAVAQPKNHIGEAMADIMVAGGCTMKQEDIGDAMSAQGFHISDFQAQSMALYRGGFLTSNDSGATLQLTNWPPCE
ncbi:MAG: hypothetical protein AAGC96_02765 [Pseudomonadota bacterium]